MHLIILEDPYAKGMPICITYAVSIVHENCGRGVHVRWRETIFSN